MQVAVPFNWEERPREWKRRWGRSMRTFSSTAKQNSAVQQEAHDLESSPKLQMLQLSPVVDRQRSSPKLQMLELSPVDRQRSSSFSLLGDDPSTSESSPAGSYTTTRDAPHTRHSTLLELMEDNPSESTSPTDTEHSESSNASKATTLIELFKKESTAVPDEVEEPVRHQAVSKRYGAAQGTIKRRTSYLPYKEGLLSIFCMSPARNPVISSMNRHR